MENLSSYFGENGYFNLFGFGLSEPDYSGETYDTTHSSV